MTGRSSTVVASRSVTSPPGVAVGILVHRTLELGLLDLDHLVARLGVRQLVDDQGLAVVGVDDLDHQLGQGNLAARQGPSVKTTQSLRRMS